MKLLAFKTLVLAQAFYQSKASLSVSFTEHKQKLGFEIGSVLRQRKQFRVIRSPDYKTPKMMSSDISTMLFYEHRNTNTNQFDRAACYSEVYHTAQDLSVFSARPHK